MSKQIWSLGRAENIPDPRVVIARHIGWSKPLGVDTTYCLPEPDNYNYAGLQNKPMNCPFIEDQVFYMDTRTKKWWSVYYVPEKQINDFLIWAENIPFDF